MSFFYFTTHRDFNSCKYWYCVRTAILYHVCMWNRCGCNPDAADDSQLMVAKGVGRGVSAVGERCGRGVDWGHYLIARRPRNDLLWSRHGALRPCRYSGRVSLVRLRWVLTFILRIQTLSISRRQGWLDIMFAHLQILEWMLQCQVSRSTQWIVML